VRYYCSFVTFRKDLICGVYSCPNITNRNSFGKCDYGYYLMITSEKFENAIGSFRSRLYSPVYTSSSSPLVCMVFRYNIYGSDDGLRVYLENYQNSSQYNLIQEVKGPLPIDKWYTALAQIDHSTYEQFRVSKSKFLSTKQINSFYPLKVIFEPFKGSSTEYASISIDAIEFVFGPCGKFCKYFSK
jgi:hypothetical protein